MLTVGLNKANMIAGIGAFFVAIIGLAVALAAGHASKPRTSRGAAGR